MYRSHIDKLQNAVSSPQEDKPHQACYTEVYAKDFAALFALVVEYGLDDERIWNLDESGCTPGKDTKGAKREKRLMRRVRQRIDELRSSSKLTA